MAYGEVARLASGNELPTLPAPRVSPPLLGSTESEWCWKKPWSMTLILSNRILKRNPCLDAQKTWSQLSYPTYPFVNHDERDQSGVKAAELLCPKCQARSWGQHGLNEGGLKCIDLHEVKWQVSPCQEAEGGLCILLPTNISHTSGLYKLYVIIMWYREHWDTIPSMAYWIGSTQVSSPLLSRPRSRHGSLQDPAVHGKRLEKRRIFSNFVILKSQILTWYTSIMSWTAPICIFTIFSKLWSYEAVSGLAMWQLWQLGWPVSNSWIVWIWQRGKPQLPQLWRDWRVNLRHHVWGYSNFARRDTCRNCQVPQQLICIWRFSYWWHGLPWSGFRNCRVIQPSPAPTSKT